MSELLLSISSPLAVRFVPGNNLIVECHLKFVILYPLVSGISSELSLSHSEKT